MLRDNMRSERVSFISWRSKRAGRRTWSTLAAETHALQRAVDKTIHTKCVLAELRVCLKKSVVVTDNLSLRRVLYSGRPVQEERLKKEFVVLRDMMVSESIDVRYIPGKLMLADSLTNSASPETLLDAMKNKKMDPLHKHDSELITKEMIEEAGINIPMAKPERVPESLISSIKMNWPLK